MTNKKSINLTDDYSISRIIKGHWQIASGHLVRGALDRSQAIRDMHAFVDAGITTFDVADIYSGAEELIGQFLGEKPSEPVQVHTKYVPDSNALGSITFDQTVAIIDRSLQRLGVETLDLVQFHWWDYDVQHYVDTALHLKKLKQQGKIRNIGVTNFDAEHLARIVNAGVDVLTAQIQYSVLDRRPENGFVNFCQQKNIHILCYGTIAGGFISERWLGQKALTPEQFENRSLTKYSLIIDEIGGWEPFQGLLRRFDEIAKNYHLTVSEIAAGYILGKTGVTGVIIGSHNAKHLDRMRRLLDTELTSSDRSMLDAVVKALPNVPGDIYALERNDPKHRGIMKFNLNSS